MKQALVESLAVPYDERALVDRYGRCVRYVRLSVVDRCDLRCRYCMPMKVEFMPRRELLSLEELIRVSRVFASLGVSKIRITGGEPLVRKDVVWLCREIATIPGIRELVMTTNGTQLPRFATSLRDAGVRRVNISLDTLDADKFVHLTRTGNLTSVLSGIDAAIAANFPGGVKLNVVMMRGFNDGEIVSLVRFALGKGMDISFIEEMPLGDVGYRRGDTYYSADSALRDLNHHFEMAPSTHDSGGPAVYWEVAGYKNRIGFITPHSHNFCHRCNRVRVSADGTLYPCLGQNDAVSLKAALRASDVSDETVRHLVVESMQIKPKGHDFNVDSEQVQVIRFMSATGG